MPGLTGKVLLNSAAWRKGEESESVLNGNDGIAAAMLSPGGLFVNKI